MKSGLKCISGQGEIRIRVYFRVQNQIGSAFALDRNVLPKYSLLWPRIVCFDPIRSSVLTRDRLLWPSRIVCFGPYLRTTI